MSKRTTDHGDRVAIVERHLAGETLKQIAESMKLNEYTVRKWWRIYRKKSWSGLAPKRSGPVSTGSLSQFDPLVKYVLLRLKREHPAWGLDVLRLALCRRPSLQGHALPSRSSIGAYVQSFAPRLKEHRPLRTKRPQSKLTDTVQAVHEGWQMDFKGEEHIPGIGLVKPFLVVDKFTGAPLSGIIHVQTEPTRKKVGLTFRDVQEDLRTVFSQWGLPDYIQMDRDPLWVGSARLEWPGTILLWLAGLGVRPVINRPHRPTDNAQVERANRTWNEQVCIGVKAQTQAELQQLTDQAFKDRREELPSRNPNCNGLPPLVAQPGLGQPRRPFSIAQEVQCFQIERVYTYLSQWEWTRKVDTTGYISMARYNRFISKAHTGQIVKVRFDVQLKKFIAFSVEGIELRQFSLPVITTEYILGQE